jgi:hypothetical protein
MAKRIIYCQEILLRYKRTKALYRCGRNLTTPFLLFALRLHISYHNGIPAHGSKISSSSRNARNSITIGALLQVFKCASITVRRDHRSPSPLPEDQYIHNSYFTTLMLEAGSWHYLRATSDRSHDEYYVK